MNPILRTLTHHTRERRESLIWTTTPTEPQSKELNQVLRSLCFTKSPLYSSIIKNKAVLQLINATHNVLNQLNCLL